MMFDCQPVLAGRLVHARPLRGDDLDALWAVASDPLIWEQHPAKERGTLDGFRTFFDESLASAGALLVTDASSGAAIGSSRFDRYDEGRREVEIGWTYLARSHWGGAYNGELKHLMLRHAFRFVDSVLFYIDVNNIRSQRAIERIGALLESGPDERDRLRYRITATPRPTQ
ncbi:MAG TPA: GNAT family N-acetyltransferase [Actinomycetota bacterium]